MVTLKDQNLSIQDVVDILEKGTNLNFIALKSIFFPIIDITYAI